MEKATLSVERQLRTLQSRLDPAYRATLRLAESEKLLSAARAQGLISASRQAELLALETRGHTTAAGAATLHSRALAGLTAQATAASGALSGALGLSGGLAVAGVVAVTAAMTKMITETIAAQKSFAQLEAVVASTGGAAGLTTAQLVAMADEMQRLTTFEDDAVIGAEAVLLRFTKIGGDVFPRALKSVLDMSAAGKDLSASAMLVGKALNDPVKGLTALTKIGITFDAAQKDLIASFLRVGDVAGAQGVVLDQLKIKYGGSAEAARNTLGGALESLGNNFGNLFEIAQPGTESLIASINELGDVLSDPNTIAAIQSFGTALLKVLALVTEASAFVIRNFEIILDLMKAVASPGTAALSAADWFNAPDPKTISDFETLTNSVTDYIEKIREKTSVESESTGASDDAVNDAKKWLQSIQERKDAMQLSIEEIREETQVTALEGVEAAKLAFYFEQMRIAKEAARKAGQIISDEELATILKATDIFGELWKQLDAVKTHNADVKKANDDVKKATEDAARTAEQHAKAIKDVQENLAFEAAQLGRTAEEQEVYNNLKQAGVSITSAEGQQIAAATRQLYQLEEATKAANDAAEARKTLQEDITFERGLIGLSDEDVEIAERLRDIYKGDIPAALASTEAAALRMNNRLEEAGEAGQAFKDALESSFVGLFTGSIKSFDEFLDHITKGIAEVAAQALASNITDKLFGGSDSAGDSLNNAGTKLTSGAAPALTSAGATLSASATALEHAAGSLANANVGAGLSAPVSGGTGLASVSTGGLEAQVASALAPAFQGFLTDLASTGYKVTSLGGYSDRNIAGTSTPSYHSVGAAIDINPLSNPVTYGSTVTNLPSNISDIAAKWGLGWGGNWSSKSDPMHFSAATGEGGSFSVDRYSGAGSMTSVSTGVTAAAPVTDAAPLPVSVVATPAPAFTGLQNVFNSPAFQTAISGFSMGYQQQDPLMGGLTGALSGFMSMGPLGAVIGGVSGAIGGLLGNMAAEKAALEAAQEQWASMAGEVEDFSNALKGKVIGDLQTSFNEAHRKFDEIAKAAKAAGEDISYLKQDLAEFERETTDAFRRSFKAVKESLKSGLGDEDPWLEAANAIAALREELLGFIADTKTAYDGEHSKNKIDRAEELSQQYVLDMVSGSTEELSELDAEVRRILGTQNEAIDLLQELGMSWKKASKAVTEAMNEALAAARETALNAIRDRSTDYLLREFAATADENNLSDVLAQFEIDAQLQREEEIEAGGYAMVDLERALAAERLQIIEDFNQAAVEATEAAIDEMNSVAKGIVDYVNELRAGSESTLSPQDTLAAAQEAYDAILALAQGGDAEAQGDITGFADDLINAAREMYASGEDFQTIFQQVQDQLLALPSVTDTTDLETATLRDVLDGIENTTAAVDDLATLIENSTPAAIALALTGVFADLDTTMDEKLSRDELIASGLATEGTIDSLIASVDLSADGQLTMLELMLANDQETADMIKGVLTATPAQIASKLSGYFNMLDTNMDGLLTADELVASGLATSGQAAYLYSLLDKGTNGPDGSLSKLDLIKTEAEGTITAIDDQDPMLTATNLLLDASDGVKKWSKYGAQDTEELTKQAVKYYPAIDQTLFEIAKFTAAEAKKDRPDDRKYGVWADIDPNKPKVSSGGIIGYAPGGIVGNGTWNVDSVMARHANGGEIMLAGGEGVINAAATSMIGPSVIDLINSTGRLPQNDNGQYFADQNRVLLAGFGATIEALQGELSLLRTEVKRSGEGIEQAVERRPVQKSKPRAA
jgi:hypothetical protein